MALSEKDISEINRRYVAGEGTSALARVFHISPAAVRYHLKKEGTYVAPDAQDQTMESDADLGIGEDDQAPDPLAALMNDPKFAKLIDAAVTARMAQMGAIPTPSTQSEDFKAFTAALAHLIEVNAMQQPGYSKPIPAEELDRRAAGCVEMKALLKNYEAQTNPPLYLLGAKFFECTNAIMYEAGTQIRTYMPPAENWMPQNEPAQKVYAAMFQWIGGKTPDIGDQLESAMIASKGPPLVTGALNAAQRRGPVEVVDAPRQDVGRKRVAGTIVPERRDVSMAERASGPAGPVFIGDAAA